MKNQNEIWVDKIREYCKKYDIPLEFLPEIIAEPKVIPMVRGKAFEFSAMLKLKKILSDKEWVVDKPVMNAQFGFHDVDVRVIHKPTRKVIGIECKLAAKGKFRKFSNGIRQISVKCMRSRTLGESKVNELAPKIGVPVELLKVHNDQYIPSDFNVVITSIANAFYTTDEETDLFEWSPSDDAKEFLKEISGLDNDNNLQHFAYNKMYVATSDSLAITEATGIKCSRNKCTKPENCGFIPNYPLIQFAPKQNTPSSTWVEVEKCEELFKKLIANSTQLETFNGFF